MKDYPTSGNVLMVFAPVNWGKAQKKKDDLAKRDCITLGQLDMVYGEDGLAKMVVKNNLTGVYSMGMNREMMNQQTADITADLFVSRYGNECTMYALMIYFSGYLTDYKSTYLNYDVQDILLQFSKKFRQWWVQKMGTGEKKVEVDVPTGPCGIEGMMVYVKQKYNTYLQKKAAGDEDADEYDLHSGGLYKYGFVTDEIIDRVMIEAEQGIF